MLLALGRAAVRRGVDAARAFRVAGFGAAGVLALRRIGATALEDVRRVFPRREAVFLEGCFFATAA
jgi:hypothetical protein